LTLAVSRIPVDQAGCGWYEILPPPPPPRVLDRDISADWVIVGAGFAGLSAAHRIATQAPGERVVVLDAQRVGWGSSGRNSGFMIDLPHNVQSEDYSSEAGTDKQEIPMNRFAIDYARAMVEEFDVEACLSGAGRINAATDQAGMQALESYCAHVESLDEPFSRLDSDDLKKITGTDYYSGGIHTPGCLLIQPAAYIRGIARGITHTMDCKVEIFENTPVRKIETGNINRVITPGGVVQGKNVILTVNGHLESFGFCTSRLMHIFLYASMTRELTPGEKETLGGNNEWGITPAHPMGSTVRRIREGRILVRNGITYNPKIESSSAQLQRASIQHEKSFRRRFPMLPQVDMEYRWCGAVCLSRNSVPVFGELEKGVFAACCQNALGASKGTLNGILIADHAMGKSNAMIDTVLGSSDPQKLFPEPFMSLGAKAHLWWGLRVAGGDL
jgi:glycine/D-amino acid oxidase-like deaminating enzyme